MIAGVLPRPTPPCPFLVNEQAMAAIVLWASGQFDTATIAVLLSCREDQVVRTLHAAKGR